MERWGHPSGVPRRCQLLSHSMSYKITVTCCCWEIPIFVLPSKISTQGVGFTSVHSMAVEQYDLMPITHRLMPESLEAFF